MAASRKIGLQPTLRTTLGGSDANIYNAKGLACIVMATGMDKIHTHDECISRESLVATARLTYQVLREAPQNKGKRESWDLQMRRVVLCFLADAIHSIMEDIT